MGSDNGTFIDTCFNPRSRMGSDPSSLYRQPQLGNVSIHAPAWGATANRFKYYLWLILVSIHAPAWGATVIKVIGVATDTSFNPRSRMGSDLMLPLNHRVSYRFQSTLPHGERLYGLWHFRSNKQCFNPRSRMGSDVCARCITRHLIKVSIHAPAWGATSFEIHMI